MLLFLQWILFFSPSGVLFVTKGTFGQLTCEWQYSFDEFTKEPFIVHGRRLRIEAKVCWIDFFENLELKITHWNGALYNFPISFIDIALSYCGFPLHLLSYSGLKKSKLGQEKIRDFMCYCIDNNVPGSSLSRTPNFSLLSKTQKWENHLYTSESLAVPYKMLFPENLKKRHLKSYLSKTVTGTSFSFYRYSFSFYRY